MDAKVPGVAQVCDCFSSYFTCSPKILEGAKMRFRGVFTFAAFAVVFGLLLPLATFAQSVVTGALGGTVTDPSGAVVTDAKLTITSSATNESQISQSTPNGTYQFALLTPGVYKLSVEKSGFKTTSQNVTVLLGQTTPINIKLELGAGSTVIEVTGAPPLLQTQDANITSSFSQLEISEIPNPGGDITYSAQSAAGITMNNSAGGGFGNFSAFGLPATANLFTVNGNDENCPFLNLNNSGSSNLLLGGNEVQEVAVVTNAYTGQYGRQAGAQLDYSTLSGTNQYHGDAVYYWTGRELNANDPINKATGGTRPFENNNQWAGRFGGPIKKDKLFFFVNTEGIRYIFGAIHPATVPTPAFEAFTLAHIPADAATQAFYNNAFHLWNTAPNIATATPNPNSCGTLAVPGGACTASFTDSVSNGNNEWLVTARGDWVISDKDKIFARYRIDHGVQPTYTDTINPAFNTSSIQPQWETQLNWSHVFSPTVANNFVPSLNWYQAIFGGTPAPGLALFPGILNFTDGSITNLGFGSGSPGGFASGFDFPQGRKVTQYGIIDDLSVLRGNHNLKMGVNFRRDDISDHTASINAAYGIDNVNLAEFATGQLAPVGCLVAGNCGFAQQNFAIHLSQPLAYYSLGAYFQDTYRVSSKLTLTLTARFDRNSSGVCQKNCVQLPFTPFNSMQHGATIPYDQSFQNGLHAILPNIEKVVFEPRIGMAWTPWGQNTVIRAGVGIFSDLYAGDILDNFTTNFPQVNAFVLSSGQVAFDNLAPASTAFPLAGLTSVRGCNSGFNTNFFGGGDLNTYQAANPGCAVPQLFDVNRNPQNPKFLEWNVMVQHSFGTRTMVSANYVGNRGYDLFYFNGYLNAFGFGNLPAAAADPRVQRAVFVNNNGISNYNGLTLSIQEQNWHGLTSRFNYTYSKALDDASNGGNPTTPFSVFNSIGAQIDPFNPRANYGPADYDARHQLSMNYVYELPFKSQNRLKDAAIGGWQWSGTLFYRTGFPFSVLDQLTVGGLAATNNMSTATSFILLQPNTSKRNYGNGGSCIFGTAQPACFTAAQFTNPTDGFAGGVAGRNAFRGPGFLGGDMSIRKNFKVTERVNFQLGFNAYNWFNHANYAGPVPSTGFGPLFGKNFTTLTPPTSPYGAFAAAATDMRIAQIQAKLLF